MNFIPKTPTSGAVIDAVMNGREPACAIDLGRGELLACNPAGAALWGVAAGELHPLSLDGAMPALAHLRTAEGSATAEPIVFWTPRGTLGAPCSSRRIGASSPIVLVTWPQVGRDNDVEPTQSGPAREPIVSAGDEAALREIARRIRQEPGAEEAQYDASPTKNLALPDNPQPTRQALARLAHELRTPLAAVIALAETMAEEHLGPLPSERYRGYMRDIRESARHALALVDSMGEQDPLDGKLELVFAEVDLNETAGACVSAMQPLADKAGVSLSTELCGRLPRVIADARSLKQILLNLLANSAKHAGTGAEVVVRTGYEVAGPIWIEVADTGRGISVAHIAQGLTADTRAKANGGSGLGLPLSRRLAEANGGRLDVQAGSTRGTRVRVTFAKDRAVPV